MALLDVDFASHTVESLVSLLPKDENADWEWKSSDLFSTPQEFDKKLGRAVCAFANTGGGYFILGLENDKRPKKCPEHIGRTPTTAWLHHKVSALTAYPVRGVKIHRLEFKDNSAECIFVLEIPDSPQAPHQALPEKTYLWRYGDRTEVAPHFHIDNLFRRVNHSVISVEFALSAIQGITRSAGHFIRATFDVRILNRSRVIAQPCGCVIIPDKECGWAYDNGENEKLLFCNFLFPQSGRDDIVCFDYKLSNSTREVSETIVFPSRYSVPFVKKLRFRYLTYSQNYNSEPEERCLSDIAHKDQVALAGKESTEAPWWKAWDFSDEVRKTWDRI